MKMSFYLDKKNAYQIIDKLYREGQSEQAIKFKIQTMFGFGSKIVEDRLKLIEAISQKD